MGHPFSAFHFADWNSVCSSGHHFKLGAGIVSENFCIILQCGGELRARPWRKCQRLDYGSFTGLAVNETLGRTSESFRLMTERRVGASGPKGERLGEVRSKILSRVGERRC